jgi:hypothetical protein
MRLPTEGLPKNSVDPVLLACSVVEGSRAWLQKPASAAQLVAHACDPLCSLRSQDRRYYILQERSRVVVQHEVQMPTLYASGTYRQPISTASLGVARIRVR